ncbi:R3H domain-containing protein 1 [Mortierella sp. NVP85]|nr:R3H domain-containing protein 1 [Mortierella sp. NVP85]
MVSNHNPIETWDQPGKTKGAEQWLHEECERDRRINDRSTISCGHHVRRQVQAEVVPIKTKAKTESITTVASNAVAIDLLSLSLSSSPSSSPSPSPLLSDSPSALSPTSDPASDSVSTFMLTKVEEPLECDNAKENESFIDSDTAASMVHEEHGGNSSTVTAYADGVASAVFQPTTHRPAVMASILRNSAIQALDSRLGTTPSSSSSTGGEVLDEVLLTALSKRQERLFLLRLDRDYCNFIENTSQGHLELPWLNSYFRMLIHRSANYFGLRREVDASHKRIRLFKTEHSMIPTLRFCDLVEHDEEGQHGPRPANLRNASQDEASVAAVDMSAEQHQQLPAQPQRAPTEPTPITVLKRCPLPPRPVSACESRCGESFIGTTSRRTMVSMEQREKAYAEARARIFCEDEGGKGKKEPSAKQEQMATCTREGKESEEGVAEVAIATEESGNHVVDEEVDRVEAEQVVTRLESSCDIVKPLPRRSSGIANAGGAQAGLTRRISTGSTASSSSGTTMVDTSTKSDIMSPGGFQSPASTSSGSSRTGSTTDYFTRQHYQGVPSGAMHGGGNLPDQRSRPDMRAHNTSHRRGTLEGIRLRFINNSINNSPTIIIRILPIHIPIPIRINILTIATASHASTVAPKAIITIAHAAMDLSSKAVAITKYLTFGPVMSMVGILGSHSREATMETR